ncbi:hypothetical protein [Altericroceibacterium xinjiangense]|uniref:hypothetical protein n=1 Tax=Altericroceibacterium xinjiangense TaxID=762261 RepID=UPI0013E0D298|nr:hypothetical protein [Altericroceibacterium xinjiangense]
MVEGTVLQIRKWESLFPAEQARIAGIDRRLRTAEFDSVVRDMLAPRQEKAA